MDWQAPWEVCFGPVQSKTHAHDGQSLHPRVTACYSTDKMLHAMRMCLLGVCVCVCVSVGNAYKSEAHGVRLTIGTVSSTQEICSLPSQC